MWRVIAILFILCGWVMYGVALFSPAIAFDSVGPEGGWHETKTGLRCLRDTADVTYWMFSPLFPLYLAANGLMLSSPLLVAAPPMAQRAWGLMLVIAYPITLTAPSCALEVSAALIGCHLWMHSFLVTGVGFLVATRGEKG